MEYHLKLAQHAKRDKRIVAMYAKVGSLAKVARRFGLTRSRVHQIVHGKRGDGTRA